MTHASLARSVAAFRNAFLKELGETSCELSALLMRVPQAAPGSAEYERLRVLTHSLAGRGGTFGFADLSAAAAEVNALLESDGRSIREAAYDLLVEVSRALDPPPRT